MSDEQRNRSRRRVSSFVAPKNRSLSQPRLLSSETALTCSAFLSLSRAMDIPRRARGDRRRVALTRNEGRDQRRVSLQTESRTISCSLDTSLDLLPSPASSHTPIPYPCRWVTPSIPLSLLLCFLPRSPSLLSSARRSVSFSSKFKQCDLP